mmetsp:Transcript_1454/g.6360  ORF Transcript_1454/g.6360 Transcript_1454/m.6360 type:complete len:252 (-) Transcript_1454:1164-1919(-)
MDGSSSPGGLLWLLWAFACVLGSMWVNVIFGHPSKWRSTRSVALSKQRVGVVQRGETTKRPARRRLGMSLPAELQSRVVEFLLPKEVAAVTSVCRSWRACGDLVLWRRVADITKQAATREVQRLVGSSGGNGTEQLALPSRSSQLRQAGLRSYGRWLVTLRDDALQALCDRGRVAVLIAGSIYDLTDFRGSHPGGADILNSAAGSDATRLFELAAHSTHALRQAKTFRVMECLAADDPDTVLLKKTQESWF